MIWLRFGKTTLVKVSVCILFSCSQAAETAQKHICATWKTEEESNIVEFRGGCVQDYDMVIREAEERRLAGL